MYEVHVIQEGYSRLNEAGVMTANGTCTLIKGDKFNVVVDTLSPWDSEALVKGLAVHGLAPSDITHLVGGVLRARRPLKGFNIFSPKHPLGSQYNLI